MKIKPREIKMFAKFKITEPNQIVIICIVEKI